MKGGQLKTFILLLCLAVTLSLTVMAVSEGNDAEETSDHYVSTELGLRGTVENSSPEML